MDFFFLPYNYSQNVNKHMDIFDKKVTSKWDAMREFVWDLEQDQQEQVYNKLWKFQGEKLEDEYDKAKGQGKNK